MIGMEELAAALKASVRRAACSSRLIGVVKSAVSSSALVNLGQSAFLVFHLGGGPVGLGSGAVLMVVIIAWWSDVRVGCRPHVVRGAKVEETNERSSLPPRTCVGVLRSLRRMISGTSSSTSEIWRPAALVLDLEPKMG